MADGAVCISIWRVSSAPALTWLTGLSCGLVLQDVPATDAVVALLHVLLLLLVVMHSGLLAMSVTFCRPPDVLCYALSFCRPAARVVAQHA